MGDTRDRAMALAMLVEAFGVKGEDMKPVRVRAYEDALKDIPIPLLNAAVRKAIETRTFFPKVAELREDAESCRRELLDRTVFAACAICNYTGWQEVQVENVARVTRCVCWRAYMDKLASLGVGEKPLALPAGRDRVTVGEEP